MRPIRAFFVVAAATLMAGATACNRPNLDATGGGYEEFATSGAEADTGRIAPHEEPAPSDGAAADTGAAEH